MGKYKYFLNWPPQNQQKNEKKAVERRRNETEKNTESNDRNISEDWGTNSVVWCSKCFINGSETRLDYAVVGIVVRYYPPYHIK